MPTKAELSQTLDNTQRELAALKEVVRDRLLEAIDTGEICRDGGTQALKDFGLHVPSVTTSGTLTVTLDFEGWMTDDHEDGWNGLEPTQDAWDTFLNDVGEELYEVFRTTKLHNGTTLSYSSVDADNSISEEVEDH